MDSVKGRLSWIACVALVASLVLAPGAAAEHHRDCEGDEGPVVLGGEVYTQDCIGVVVHATNGMYGCEGTTIGGEELYAHVIEGRDCHTGVVLER